MDLLQKIGGRKFLMAMIAIGIGVYLEVSGKGLSVNMASMLVALVGSFHISNHMTTAAFMRSRQSGGGQDPKMDALVSKVDQVHQVAMNAQGQEPVKQFNATLQGIHQNLAAVQDNSVQVAQGLVGLAKEVANIKKALAQQLSGQ